MKSAVFPLRKWKRVAVFYADRSAASSAASSASDPALLQLEARPTAADEKGGEAGAQRTKGARASEGRRISYQKRAVRARGDPVSPQAVGPANTHHLRRSHPRAAVFPGLEQHRRARRSAVEVERGQTRRGLVAHDPRPGARRAMLACSPMPTCARPQWVRAHL